MKKSLSFRSWFYFRTGYSTYFAMIFASINTLTVTYYLAIEQIPALKEIFPSFYIYSLIVVSVGFPLLIFVGYLHFKKSAGFSSEAEINVESHPYYFKLPPGHNKEVLFPILLEIMQILVKISNNQKLSDADDEKIKSLTEKINSLIEGGSVGTTKNF